VQKLDIYVTICGKSVTCGKLGVNQLPEHRTPNYSVVLGNSGGSGSGSICVEERNNIPMVVSRVGRKEGDSGLERNTPKRPKWWPLYVEGAHNQMFVVVFSSRSTFALIYFFLL